MLTRCFYPRDPCGPRLSPSGESLDFNGFYPRDPCGPRPATAALWCMLVLFLSARPVRAATSYAARSASCSDCFYPRDPCGPRPASGGW